MPVPLRAVPGSDHCPAMKGIETILVHTNLAALKPRSDHCPAMKGIETSTGEDPAHASMKKRPLPRNEGD